MRGELLTACTDRDFIKWSFVFWVGQVLTVTGIMTVLLRILR